MVFCPSLFNWKSLSIVFFSVLFTVFTMFPFRAKQLVRQLFLFVMIYFLFVLKMCGIFFFLSHSFLFSANDVLVRFIHIFHPMTFFFQ